MAYDCMEWVFLALAKPVLRYSKVKVLEAAAMKPADPAFLHPVMAPDCFSNRPDRRGTATCAGVL